MPHCAVEFPALASSTARAVQLTPHFKSAPASFKSGYERRACRRGCTRSAMDGFSLITDYSLPLQSLGMFDGGTNAVPSMFPVDGYASVAHFSSEGRSIVRTEDEQKSKGRDLFFCDWPELGGFDDFETDMSNLNTTFEVGSNYFDDTLWSSVYSPDDGLVPISCFDSTTNVSSVQNQSATATLIESSVSVPDQIKMSHSTKIKQETMNDGRNHAPSSNEAHASSSREIDQFSLFIDAELFGPFIDDNITSTKQTGGYEGLEAIIRSKGEMQQAPTASSTMLPDEPVVTSSTCSGPDLVAAQIPCSKRKLNDPLHGTPDMLLEGLAENPLEMYFPPLTTSEQSEMLMSDTSTQTHEQFAGSTSAPNCAGMQFCSTDMRFVALHEQPPSTLILEAVPVKDLGFQKLQNGMNQMDVATKGRIRDALYRLANSVEQRHYVASTSGLAVGSSSSERFRSGRWTEMQTNPMDQSVAQLLLRKPLYRNSVTSSRMT